MNENLEGNPLTPEPIPELTPQQEADILVRTYIAEGKNQPIIVMGATEENKSAISAAMNEIRASEGSGVVIPELIFVKDEEELKLRMPNIAIVDDEGGTMKEAMHKLTISGEEFPEAMLLNDKPPQPWRPEARPPWERRPGKRGRRK